MEKYFVKYVGTLTGQYELTDGLCTNRSIRKLSRCQCLYSLGISEQFCFVLSIALVLILKLI